MQVNKNLYRIFYPYPNDSETLLSSIATNPWKFQCAA
jgi:hypothetical protein